MSQPAPSPSPQSAAARYRSAYALAASVTNVGSGIKVLGALAGAGLGLVVAVGAYGATAGTGRLTGLPDAVVIPLMLAGGLAVTVGLGLYAAGSLLSCVGRILQMQTDTAVGVSPSLSQSERIEIIGAG